MQRGREHSRASALPYRVIIIMEWTDLHADEELQLQGYYSTDTDTVIQLWFVV
jgi:hypothetical protein